MLHRGLDGKTWKNWKLRTPVDFREGGKTPPFCPTFGPTFVASSLLEKATLRRLICPQLLSVLRAVEITAFAFCASFISCSGTWLVDGTEDVDDFRNIISMDLIQFSKDSIYYTLIFDIFSYIFIYIFNVFSIYATYFQYIFQCIFNIFSISFQYLFNIFSIHFQYIFNTSSLAFQRCSILQYRLYRIFNR